MNKNSPKKENIASVKRGPLLRQKNRQNATIKSRAIVSTDSSSSEDENNIKQSPSLLNQHVGKISRKICNRSPKQDKITNNVSDSSSEDVGELENLKVGQNDSPEYNVYLIFPVRDFWISKFMTDFCND